MLSKKSGLSGPATALSSTGTANGDHGVCSPGMGNEADVIRHELVKKIVNAYRRHRGTGETDSKR